MTPRRNENVRRRVIFASCFNRMGVQKASVGFDTLNPIMVKTSLIRGMNTIDISLTIGFQGLKIERRVLDLKTIFRSVSI